MPNLEQIKILQWRDDPLSWLDERMGIDPKTIKWSLNPEYQEDDFEWDDKADPITPDPVLQMFEGLANGYNVGVESGTGVGKTFACALVALWFVDCWRIKRNEDGEIEEPGGQVTVCATTEKQLKGVFWKELRQHLRKFKNYHPQLESNDLQIRMDPREDSKESWGIRGLVASVGASEDISTAVAGQHSPHQLFIIDETAGVHPAIMDAIISTTTGSHNLILAVGNPLHQEDPLHEFCTMEGTKHLRVSEWDHPNIVTENPDFIDGCITRDKIRWRLNKFKDPEHHRILSHVHGVSPATSGQTLMSRQAIEKAERFTKIEPKKKIDLTDIGDDESVCRIYGYWDWDEDGNIKRDYKGRPKQTDEIVKEDYLDRYIIFADVAGDTQGGDAHACTVFDRIRRKVCAVARMRGLRTDYVKVILKLAEIYTIEYGNGRTQSPLICHERNNVGGLTMVPSFAKYPNLFHSKNLNMVNPDPRSTVGWSTNRQTRPDMMEALKEWAAELHVKPWMLTDKNLLSEAKTFSKNPDTGKYEAEGNKHDDIVMSLSGALAVDSLEPQPRPTDRFNNEEEDKGKSFHSEFMDQTVMNSPYDDVQLPNYDLPY